MSEGRVCRGRRYFLRELERRGWGWYVFWWMYLRPRLILARMSFWVERGRVEGMKIRRDFEEAGFLLDYYCYCFCCGLY